jgi:hypothetical protein
MGQITPDMGQDACVPALTADDQANDTNGFGAGHSGLDTVWTEKGWGWPRFGQGGGLWGVLAAPLHA